ncbi:hypothetical protein FRC05_000706 [Tulasnella sp. 425]|nr:hypothetical protein FRC05_000706 [Tulasnella sp. 425]
MLHRATLRETAPNEVRGHVEVFVPETNLWLGFLGYSFGATGADLSISGNKLGAALVSFVPNPEGKPVQLRIENVPSDVYHPYLGLAMDEPLLKVQEHRPLPASRSPGSPTSGPSMPSIHAVADSAQKISMPVPAPSESAARGKDDRYRRAAKTANLWEKASAAVWTYDVNNKELGALWMNGDGSEEQLAGE